ncbi:hypothetical protein CHL78_005890 [Romboutsia weinsteinii]|uniref:ABC-three component systems C-terminal domain-containing protein n=1 Tax=Romboutsia weinsteinii TaxID=2020949 RepID=A0A371J6X8_9FIRM|nr:ABC-three component system protein [Romboutsia weinsteinii]RDY28428.1 hypothetical protein CHL78_005890 [Romboutsia weinsteinii]
MQEIFEASSDNATSSWYGFESQGRMGILYFLRRLNSVDLEEWNKFILEYEYMEDFAIGYKNSDDKLIYEDIYQVKARESMSKEDIKKVYGELGFKQSILGEKTGVHLISLCKIKEDIEIKSVIDDYIQRHIEETDLLLSYSDLEVIKENLKLKNSKSELKTIRKTVRNKFKELKYITEDNIKIYCEELTEEYKSYIDNIENIDINVINEDFNKINFSISENLKLIIDKLEPDKQYKQCEDYIQKLRNALVYFLASKLENYILEKDQSIFRITCKEIIDIISQDQSKISQQQYLYLNSKKLEHEFKIYCDDECLEIDNCDSCGIKKIVRNIRSLSIDEFKSLMINSNPHIEIKGIDYNEASSMLESGKLQEFVFKEIKANKYDLEHIDMQTYLKYVGGRYMFSFINISRQDSLLKKLDRNSIFNRHIYEDNDVILNCHINLQYTIGQTLSINQHWDDNTEKESKKILSSNIELKSFDNIGGNDERGTT